jgi:hypothetical protein
LNNTCNNTNKALKEKAEGLKPPQAAKNQVNDMAHKARSLHDKPDDSLKAVREETTGDSLVALC